MARIAKPGNSSLRCAKTLKCLPKCRKQSAHRREEFSHYLFSGHDDSPFLWARESPFVTLSKTGNMIRPQNQGIQRYSAMDGIFRSGGLRCRHTKSSYHTFKRFKVYIYAGQWLYSKSITFCASPRRPKTDFQRPGCSRPIALPSSNHASNPKIVTSYVLNPSLNFPSSLP